MNKASKQLLKLIQSGKYCVVYKGGGSAPEAPPPPPPPAPSRWWYDRNGDAQEYRPMSDSLPTDRYISPNAAAEANPKQWLYDEMGNTTKQVFTSDVKSGNYDQSMNLGPKQTPYRYWYDVYGVQQTYAPVTTPVGEGYYEDPTKAPKSPNYRPAVALNETDSSLQAQGDAASSPQDLEAAKLKAQKRRQQGQSQTLTVLGDTSAMGDSDGKNLLGQ